MSVVGGSRCRHRLLDLPRLVRLFSPPSTLSVLSFAGDKSSASSQILAWVSGIVAALFVAHTELAAAFVFGAKPLSQLSLVSQGLVGLMAASSIGVVNEVKKAIDGTDSARVPPLQ